MQAGVSEWCGAVIGNGIRDGTGIGTPAERRGPALVVGGEALPVGREAPPQLGRDRGLLRLEELQGAQPVRAHDHVLEHLETCGTAPACCGRGAAAGGVHHQVHGHLGGGGGAAARGRAALGQLDTAPLGQLHRLATVVVQAERRRCRVRRLLDVEVGGEAEVRGAEEGAHLHERHLGRVGGGHAACRQDAKLGVAARPADNAQPLWVGKGVLFAVCFSAQRK
eukprot:scaffold65211_cov58-Phaeocystis_antarctica.AAC.3